MKESDGKKKVKEAVFMAALLVHHRPIKPNGLWGCAVTGRTDRYTGVTGICFPVFVCVSLLSTGQLRFNDRMINGQPDYSWQTVHDWVCVLCICACLPLRVHVLPCQRERWQSAWLLTYFCKKTREKFKSANVSHTQLFREARRRESAEFIAS